MDNPTIIALSTPPGRSGLAVIRLSGPLCREVLREALRCGEPPDRVMLHGAFRDPASGEVLDRLNFVYFRAPKSYTGEDMLELYAHGNPFLVSRIMAVALRWEGLRAAGPGEFTRRRLEHGKLDLVQAEAVHQLVCASSTQALDNANRLLQGSLSRPLESLRNRLESLSARLELDVDFAEEEAEPDYETWKPRITEIARALHDLAETWKRGRRLRHEPRVALFGLPNAGKSSLINAMLRQERLMVNELPGTTRDYVEVPVNLESGRVLVIDTAGLGPSGDPLRDQAERQAREIIGEADYRVLVVDGRQPEAPGLDPGLPRNLTVYTRGDLPEYAGPPEGRRVSGKTGEGVDGLLEHLDRELFFNASPSSETFLATERQYRCIGEAEQAAARALEIIERRPAAELLAFEIRGARDRLGELLGVSGPEDIINRVFADFCIGK
jgi:tRNA U34 5-carboxymethylaminomethyl modifying GTPase MnmE/TrmE